MSDIKHDDIMRGFPPSAERQVTLANWMQAPYTKWSYQHVSEILPAALVSRGQGAVSELSGDIQDLDNLTFRAADDRELTVAAFLLESHTDGFIVIQDGRLVCEQYFNGMMPRTRHIVFSLSKSVTGSLCGILAERGQLNPDAPIVEYVPEVADSAFGDATVRHLLDMTVSIRFNEDYTDVTGDFGGYRVATGWIPAKEYQDPAYLRAFLPTLAKADGAEHGQRFHYVSPNSDLLGWVVERASGIHFNELMEHLLWAPMGAEYDACITVDPLGAPRSAGGMCMTLRDLARFGWIHIDSMNKRDDPIIPEWWIRDMLQNGDRKAWQRGEFADSMPDVVYRSQWYIMADGSFGGLGIHGQAVFINPALGMVVAKQSSYPLAEDDTMDENLIRCIEAIAAFLMG